MTARSPFVSPVGVKKEAMSLLPTLSPDFAAGVGDQIGKAVETVKGLFGPSSAVAPAVAPVPTAITPDQVQAFKAAIQSRLGQKQMAHSLGKGLLIGGGLAGAGLLVKTLAKSLQRDPSSYTQPVESVVYRPPGRPKRRRKVASGDLLAPLNPPAVSSSPIETSLMQEDPYDYVRKLVPLAVGLPLGLMGAKKVTDMVRGIARHNELQAAQQEFEQAMQEYAATANQPKKIDRERKIASMSEREQQLFRLAENCVELSKTASILGSVGKGTLAYMALAPLLTGVYGFNQTWDARKLKDLDIAERQLNIAREQTNPTFMVASLKDTPGVNDTNPEDDEADDADLREAVRSGYHTDYL